MFSNAVSLLSSLIFRFYYEVSQVFHIFQPMRCKDLFVNLTFFLIEKYHHWNARRIIKFYCLMFHGNELGGFVRSFFLLGQYV